MTLTVQFYTLTAMIAMGIEVGMALDTYGRLLQPRKRGFSLFLTDVLFWIVQGLLIFFVLLNVNEGEVRFYIFVALLCGFALYRALFQTCYNQVLTVCIRFVQQMTRLGISFVRLFILRPMTFMFRVIFQLLTLLAGLLLALAHHLVKICSIIFMSFARLLWVFLPEYVKKRLKKLAGILKIVQNKITKWIRRT